jgi:hypothetical protein
MHRGSRSPGRQSGLTMTERMQAFFARTPQADEEWAQAEMAILGELERSLASSQRALLAGKVVALEQATAEQGRLQKALAVLGDRGSPGDRSRSGLAGESALGLIGPLKEARERVLRLGRVQAAILQRMQRSTRALANLRTGSTGGYDCLGQGVGAAKAEAAGGGKEGREWRD